MERFAITFSTTGEPTAVSTLYAGLAQRTVGHDECLAMPAVLIQKQNILSGGVAKYSDLIMGVLKAAAGPGKQKIGSP